MKRNILYGIVAIFGTLVLVGIITPTPEPKVAQVEPVIYQELLASTSTPQVVATTTAIEEKKETPVVKTVTPVVSATLTPSPASQYTYYSVTDVVDGDTIKISMNGSTETLRLIGMDTPETVDPRKPVQCFGKEASKKGKELLLNKKVRIEKDPTQGERDKYDRLLVYVYRDDGIFYNKLMIEQGYAHEYTYNTPYKYQSEFKSAQKSAEQNQLGLWSPTTCNGDTTSTTMTPVAPTKTTTASSGTYYTSSYYSTKYYYPEACTDWQSLSKSYLKSFASLDALLAAYPSRTLSPTCQ